jgi:cell pole-organizing protein PopZ
MSNAQHEPTMEEILASIRKIISEDAPEAGAPAEPAAPAPVAAAPAPAPMPAAAPAPIALAPEPFHDDVLELTQEVEEPPQPVEEIVFETVAPAPAASSDIFSDQTRKAMEDTFNSIPDEPEPPARAPAPRLAPIDGGTVENVFERAVRESFEPVLQKYIQDNSAAVLEGMKPLIREWMDEHFPALLDGAVRAEVERVVKARGTKR